MIKIGQACGDNRTVPFVKLLDSLPPAVVRFLPTLRVTLTAPTNTTKTNGRIHAVTTSHVGRSHGGRAKARKMTRTMVALSPRNTRPDHEDADRRRTETR